MLHIMTLGNAYEEAMLLAENYQGLAETMGIAYKDAFAYADNKIDRFLCAINLFGARRESTVVNVKDIAFEAMPVTPLDLQGRFLLDFDSDAHLAMEDSQANQTRLIVLIDGVSYPLRDTAFPSICERIGISGFALERIPRELLAEHMNAYVKTSLSQGKVIHNNGKIEVVLGPKYPLLPAENIMQAAAEFFASYDGGTDVNFKGGSFSHTRSDAAWRIGHVNVHTPINTGFNKTLFEQSVRISTSDSGLKAITIAPEMREVGDERFGLSYCLPIQLEHKGKLDIEIFKEQLSLIGRNFDSSMKKIQELTDTNLVYPANVLLALLKWLKVPAKYGTEVYERRKEMWGSDEQSAYTVYGSLSEILAYVYQDEPKMRAVAECQERFARGLGFDFIKYDLPGTYSFTDKLIGIKAA